MKPELIANELIPYLAYGVKVMASRNEVYELIGIKGEICFLKGLTYPVDISDVKPILRPMKDVFKPFKEDGSSPFIPAKVLWSVDSDEENEFALYGTIPQYWS